MLLAEMFWHKIRAFIFSLHVVYFSQTESTAEIMNKEMDSLMEHSGVVEAERFSAAVLWEKFDYTSWQREYFDEMSPERISQEAEKFEREDPYAGNAVRL